MGKVVLEDQKMLTPSAASPSCPRAYRDFPNASIDNLWEVGGFKWISYGLRFFQKQLNWDILGSKT